MKKYSMLVCVLFLSVFIVSDVFSRDFCDQRPKENGLCNIPFNARMGKEIIGKEYVYECCDDDFTLTQFIEPDLLLFTWIPCESHCWSFQRVLAGKRLMLKIDKNLFQTYRRKQRMINYLKFENFKGMVWGETPFKVIDVQESVMSDGSIVNIAIIVRKDNEK